MHFRSCICVRERWRAWVPNRSFKFIYQGGFWSFLWCVWRRQRSWRWGNWFNNGNCTWGGQIIVVDMRQCMRVDRLLRLLKCAIGRLALYEFDWRIECAETLTCSYITLWDWYFGWFLNILIWVIDCESWEGRFHGDDMGILLEYNNVLVLV